MAINFILPLRIIQAVFAIILLGLTAFVVNVTGGWFDAVNFLLFCSIWTILVLAYLVVTPMFAPSLHNRWAVLALEAVTMIFWFSGFIAVAAVAAPLHCFDNGNGNCDSLNSMKAAAAFGAFEWLAWVGTLGLVIKALMEYRNSSAAEQHMEAGSSPEGGLVPAPIAAAGTGVEMHPGGQSETDGKEGKLDLSDDLRSTSRRTDTPPVLPPPVHDGGRGLEMPEPGMYGGVEK